MNINPKLADAYRHLRAKGYSARDAIIHARTTLAFQALESEGHARLRFERDTEPFDCDHADDRMAKLADEEGVWGLVSERKCPCCEQWVEVESVWGLIGQNGGGYEYDLMRDVLRAVGERWGA